jgi:hypothetical protein
MPDNVFSAFQMPKFPFPKFEVPDLPVTAPFRDLVQKAAEQATKTIETLDKITDEATKLVRVERRHHRHRLQSQAYRSLARKCACGIRIFPQPDGRDVSS